MLILVFSPSYSYAYSVTTAINIFVTVFPDKVSFPWSLALEDLSCYTLQNGMKLHFLKPVSANATVGISAKYQNDEGVLGTLGLCVHIDTTPVHISLSQEQVRLYFIQYIFQKSSGNLSILEVLWRG